MTTIHTFESADIEYLRHGAEPLLAHIYRPKGKGPFPLMISVHGGAWSLFDRFEDRVINETLAKSGVVVASIDFRVPPNAPGYPASVADINYAVRWFKSHAAEFASRADKVGIIGGSSGGHLAVLTAMRPYDSRYSELSLPMASSGAVDAKVGCAVLCWPVIDPLGRYKYMKALKAGGAPYPAVVDRAIPGHEMYWPSEASMEEASPMSIVERGEACEKPPILYIQGTIDDAHPRPFLDRFVKGYREAGGRLDLELYEGEGSSFIDRNPNGAGTPKALKRLVDYVHAELGGH